MFRALSQCKNNSYKARNAIINVSQQQCMWYSSSIVMMQHYSKAQYNNNLFNVIQNNNRFCSNNNLMNCKQQQQMITRRRCYAKDNSAAVDDDESSSAVNLGERIFLNDTIKKYLSTIQEQYDAAMSDIKQQKSQEIKKFTRLLEAKKPYDESAAKQQQLESFIATEQAKLKATKSNDAEQRELIELAQEELSEIKKQTAELETTLLQILLEESDVDAGDYHKNVVLEVRSAAGGDESSLFALELFEMYERYAELKGWNFKRSDVQMTEVGGVREATAIVKGEDVYSSLRFESGVHRIQRVPNTEKLGRVHTSTCTVAMLPEARDVDVKIDEKDLRIETMRSSGAGGQSVNKTESAVRIVHIPTGIVVTCQDQRSQISNREQAMSVLRARVFEQEKRKYDEERSSARSSQVGRGNRHEKIRTYNVPQNRITDHRIGRSVHGYDQMLAGELLDDMYSDLRVAERIEKFKEFCDNAERQQQQKQQQQQEKDGSGNKKHGGKQQASKKQ